MHDLMQWKHSAKQEQKCSWTWFEVQPCMRNFNIILGTTAEYCIQGPAEDGQFEVRHAVGILAVWYPSGHYWDYYPGTLSLGQASATHLKIISMG